MATRFLGFDHVDTRVPSLAAVEPFYDKLMPALGLARKRYANEISDGEWDYLEAGAPHNVVEYYEEASKGRAAFFIGFIEDASMKTTKTRIAFRVGSPDHMGNWSELLSTIGARNIEPSASADYPAIFFEDPAGTKLEVVARLPE
jgi:catechol 2,3-dioxygenase-like lactoylglutathione lyase family enzyme